MNKQKPRNRWTAQEWFEFAATGIAPTEPGGRSRTATNSKSLPGAGPGKAAPPSGSSLLSSPGGVRQS